MAVLTALAATILGYVLLLGANIPQDKSQLIVNGISAAAEGDHSPRQIAANSLD